MDRSRIIGSTPELERFLDEWSSSANTVSAHTSGSTGVPKPMNLLKEDMRRSARATCRFFGLNRDSVLALPLSVDYIAGKMMVVRALECGATLVVEQPSSMPFSNGFPYEHISLAAIVPAQTEGLLKLADSTRIDNLIVGGAPLSVVRERLLLDAPVNAYATYGMTETCSNVALRRVGSDCYVANPGFSFNVDQRGCLVINSAEMSFGRLVTNDMVQIISESSFRWLGRYDNVINSGGVKINPETVENALREALQRDICFYITSRPSECWGEELVGVCENGQGMTIDMLSAAALALPRYQRPKEWIMVDAIGRTSSGKIKRSRLC